MTVESAYARESKEYPDTNVLLLTRQAIHYGTIGDLVLTANAAATLASNFQSVTVGVPEKRGYSRMIASFLHAQGVSFKPFPDDLFDDHSNRSYTMMLRALAQTYRATQFQRIFVLGAHDVRYLPKIPHLNNRIDYFPNEIFWDDVPFADAYTSQVAQRYGLKIHNRLATITPPENPIVPRRQTKTCTIVNVSTSNAGKTWPFDRYVCLLHELSKMGNVTAINLPSDPDAREMVQATGADIYESPHLGDILNAIDCAEVYIGGDTGLTHCASVMGKPTVAVYPSVNVPVWGPVTPTGLTRIVDETDVSDVRVESVLQALSEFTR